MDSATQPILCCIGESVSERATQFSMERAFAEHGLDWRAITVEVSPGDLGVALAGMKAMKIRAIRFFGDAQLHCPPYLAYPPIKADAAAATPVAADLPPVSSAILQDGKWSTWHTDGICLLEMLAGHAIAPVIDFLLVGDARLPKSVATHLLTSDTPSTVAWLRPPAEFASLPKVVSLAAANEWLAAADEVAAADGPATAAVADGMPADATQANGNPTGMQANAKPQPPSADPLSAPGGKGCGERLVCIVGATEADANIIAKRVVLAASDVSQIVCVWVGEECRRVANKRNAATNILHKHIDPSELWIAGEVYDFHRWTGLHVEPSLIRDAFDEFSAF